MSDKGDEILAELGPDAEAAIRTKNAIAMECLQHLFTSVPYGHEFELSNGFTGRLKKFVEPRERDGALEAGVDVTLLKDGKHVGEIEFTIRKTGWGMSLV